MISKIKLIVAMDMLFLFLLALSGSASGIASEILYYLAFIAPTGIALNHLYDADKSSHGSSDVARETIVRELKVDFSLTKDNLSLFVPTIIPSISVILAISFVTSFFMGLFGSENITHFEEPFVLAIITHALIPAILEELLFRFAPIKLLSENKKTALLISSLMFAFAHASFFQIPYAFLAGVIFSGLYIVTGSILPSIILHFLNNLFSLLSLYGYLNPVIYVVLAILLVASLCILILKRSCYTKRIKASFGDGEKITFSYYPLIFIITSLVLAISSIFY